ncbi:Rieske 2Fe-2S domain-containing protein [Spirillospora sp. CA-255316]
MFPLNAWYAAAWDTEVGRRLLARTICERPVVLYRTTEGTAVALADACWHRLVPLSLGPAAPGTCHYFWAFTRNYHLRDQGLTNLMRQNVARVFAQDTAMLNAQQRAIEADPGHEFYNLNIDIGGMWVRRIIDAKVAAEQGRERTHPTSLASAAATTRRTA